MHVNPWCRGKVSACGPKVSQDVWVRIPAQDELSLLFNYFFIPRNILELSYFFYSGEVLPVTVVYNMCLLTLGVNSLILVHLVIVSE